MRLDDDILPLSEVWEKLRTYILTKCPKQYVIYYGLNIFRQNNRVGLAKKMPLC
jgi:hypothetical protein